MFSGIIAAVGHITQLNPRNDGTPTVRLTIEAAGLGLDDVGLGDSIACNGVCLTVVD
ncbi:riboflavin synthase, partial [Enterococcus sp. HPCN18]